MGKTDTAGTQLSGFKAKSMDIIRVFEESGFVQLPMELTYDQLIGINLCRTVHKKIGIVSRPVLCCKFQSIDFGRHGGHMGIGFAIVYTTVMVTDIDTVVIGLLPGGRTEGFCFS